MLFAKQISLSVPVSWSLNLIFFFLSRVGKITPVGNNNWWTRACCWAGFENVVSVNEIPKTFVCVSADLLLLDRCSVLYLLICATDDGWDNSECWCHGAWGYHRSCFYIYESMLKHEVQFKVHVMPSVKS